MRSQGLVELSTISNGSTKYHELLVVKYSCIQVIIFEDLFWLIDIDISS